MEVRDLSTQKRIEELRKRSETIKAGGGEKRIEKQHASGKMTARERVEKLLDPGTFNEIGMFITHRASGFDIEKSRPYGDGVVTGWGTINGRVVFVFSKDFTVFGGSLSGAHAAKIVKVQNMALKNGADRKSVV